MLVHPKLHPTFTFHNCLNLLEFEIVVMSGLCIFLKSHKMAEYVILKIESFFLGSFTL
jgi:hypothetical protein